MSVSLPFLNNAMLSSPAIDLKNPEHTALLLPMFPEYISAQYPTGYSNNFDLPQGRISFIIHRKQGEGDGYLYRPTVKLALEELRIKVVLNDRVDVDICEGMSVATRMQKLRELLQTYGLVIDMAKTTAAAAANQTSDRFLALGDGYLMRRDVLNGRYFQVVRQSEFESGDAFCIEDSLIPAFTNVHFQRLRHRLQMFQHVLSDSRFQYNGTSGLTARITKSV